MINRILYFMLFLLVANLSQSQDKYSIRIQIKDYPDTALLLTTYYGDKVLLVDTAYAEKPGSFLFEGEDKMPGGVYMAVSQKKIKLFEFIINERQQFRLTTDTINYSLHMGVKASPENQLFFDYIRFNDQLFSGSQPLRDSIGLLEYGSEEYHALRQKIDSINEVAIAYKLNIINENPDLFIAKLLGSMREIELPDSIQNSADSSASYRFYKKHYWDYIDLSDPRLLHTPMLSKKLENYFDQLVVVHPDSVIAEIDKLVLKARPNQEMVSWLIWHFVAEYQSPDYMGFDVVFIHLADQYFQKEEIINATPSVTQNIIERAEKMKPLILGSPAPNLILIDTAGNYQSFTSLTNEYILLFFWDYDCGICKKEIIELKKLMAETSSDIGLFAINVNADLDKWKKGIAEQGFMWTNVNGTRSVTEDFHDLYDTHSTPAIFLLDKDRNIIAKQLSMGQVDDFIENHEKFHSH